MNFNEWAVNAYKKQSEKEDDSQEEDLEESQRKLMAALWDNDTEVVAPPKEEKITKPVFHNVNKQLNELFQMRQNEIEKKASEKNSVPEYTENKRTSVTFENKAANFNQNEDQLLIKVPRPEKKEDSIYRRVAKFLVVIGVDEAAKIMPHLSPEQTEKIIPEIASIRYVSEEEAAEVIEEFESLMLKAKESGGIDTARNILTKAYGSKKAEELIQKSVAFPEGKPFDFLQEADSERVKLLLAGESTQVQALVLSQLEPKQAAGVINKLDEKTKSQVVLRLVKLQPVAPEILKEIAKTLEKKFQTQNTQTSQSMDGRGILAEILRRMDPLQETSLINTLAEENPDLGADLRQRLFTEEDVLNSDSRFLQNKLQSMDDREIAVLIKGKNEGFRSKIFANISKTRGAVILEEESLLTSLSKNESERVTSEFYAALRRAWEKGELRISNRDDGEVYV